jgi:hypothetical protein
VPNQELFFNLRQHIIDHYDFEWVDNKELKLDFIHTILLTTKEYYEYQLCILTCDGKWFMDTIGKLTPYWWERLEDIGLFKNYFMEV